MGRIRTSAYEPAFFLHHSNVDLWWQDWQDLSPGHFKAGPSGVVLHETGGLTHNDMLNSSKLPLFKGAKKDKDFVCVKYAPIGTKPLTPGTGGTLVGNTKQSAGGGGGGGNRRSAEEDAESSSNDNDNDNDNTEESEAEIMRGVIDNNNNALPQREARKALGILQTLPDYFFAEGGVLTSTAVPRMHAPDVDTHMRWLMQHAEDTGTPLSEADAREEAMAVLASQLEQPVVTQAQLAAMSTAELELSEMLGVSYPHLVNAIKGEQGFDNTAAALEVTLEEREQASANSEVVAPCLVCEAQMSNADYCKQNPFAAGCSTSTTTTTESDSKECNNDSNNNNNNNDVAAGQLQQLIAAQTSFLSKLAELLDSKTMQSNCEEQGGRRKRGYRVVPNDRH